MAQQLQVNLSFTADSAKAKAQIQDLQNSLNNLMKNNPTGKANLSVTKELLKAQQAAAQLSISLKNATNVNTGKLNLTQFSSELQKSGMTLEKYRIQLSALGPEGEKTFLNLAKSVMTADSAIKNSNKLVNDLWISLKNTAKWQLSSSMIKGFMGAVSTAFNYAEDLNKSLNQIQIVTGHSAEQMARFAKQANIAAKELSTTTTAYTDASLIYYQQGLDDANVKARTDITVKAANAAGTNAEEMADYLTAVWNSYKVGSDELERYVDVMAALGAGTATSLEEISTAMEKVASVGEATGVKFEQMSSIIATVSSVTRQSAETVGTAFKTIFARMADLKLDGSVEEDGVTTTLGTVSKQLAQVGVNILDANGELRDMGDVTEELMGKWGTMNKATQQAVAIAIAGKRQYTQLLALMNNQDMYKDAMNMATGAEGTLQEQADTYAKSWEAAQKRVKAAAQGIYDSLINDDFFIGLNDSIAGVLGLIEKLIDSMGGFSGVLSGLGMLAFKVFDKQINESLQKSIQSMYSMSAAGKHQNDLLRQQAVNQVKAVYADRSSGNLNTYEQIDLDIQQKRFDLQTQLMNNAKMMSEDEIKLAQAALDTNKAYAERAVTLAQTQTELEEQFNENKENAQFDIIDNFDFDWGTGDQKVAEFDELIQKYKDGSLEIKQAFQFNEAETDIFQIDDALRQLFDSAEGGAKIQLRDLKIEVNSLVDEFTSGSISEEEYTQRLEQLKSKIASVSKSMNTSRATFIEQAEAMGVSVEQAEQLADIIPQLKEAEDNTATATENFNKSCQNLIQGLERTKTTTAIFAEGLLGTMRAVSSLGMALSTLKGAWSALNDPDMSGFEKVLSVMTSLGMGIPALASSIKLFSESWDGVVESIGKAATATAGAIVAQTAQKAATDASTASTTAQMTAEELAIAVKKEQEIAEGLSLKQKLLYIAAQKLEVQVTAQEVAANSAAVVAKIADTAATGGLTVGQTLLAAATALVNGQFMIFFTLIGPIVVPILALVGAVTLLVGVFKAVSENTPEAKLAAATEEAKKAKTAFEETSQAVEDLKNNISKLESGYETLDKLDKKTNDWKKTLVDVNNQALELINKYKDVDYTFDEDGVIRIDQNSLDDIYSQKIADSVGNSITQQKAQAEQYKEEANVETVKLAGILEQAAKESFPMGTDLSYLKNMSEYAAKFLTEELNATNGIFDIDKELQKLSDLTLQYPTGVNARGETTYTNLGSPFQDIEALKKYSADILNQVEEINKLENLANDLLEQGNINLLKNAANTLGSNRSAEDLSNLDVEKIKQNKIKDIKDDDRYHWQSFNDYDVMSDATEAYMKNLVDQFATRVLGDKYEYVSQDGGNATFKTKNGEQEISYSQEDILEGLANILSAEDIQNEIISQAKNNLSNLGELVNKVSDDTVISLDNFKVSLTESLNDLRDGELYGGVLNTDDFSDAKQIFEGMIPEDITEPKQLEKYVSLLNEVDWSQADAVEHFTQKVKEQEIACEVNTDALSKYQTVQQRTSNLVESALWVQENENKTIKEKAEEVGLTTDILEDYSDKLQEENKGLKDNRELAEQTTIAQKQLSSSLDSLSKDWNDIYNNLSGADMMSKEYAESLEKLQSAMKNVLGTDLSRAFLTNEQNLLDIERAINGDEKALERLRQAAVIDIIVNIDGLNKEDQNWLKNQIATVQNDLDNIKIGAEIDTEGFDELATKLNEMVYNGEITAEEFRSIFSNLGIYPVTDNVDSPIAAKALAAARDDSDQELTITETTQAASSPLGSGTFGSTPTTVTKHVTVHNASGADTTSNVDGVMSVPQVTFSTDKNGQSHAKGYKAPSLKASAGAKSRSKANAGGTQKSPKKGSSSKGSSAPQKSKPQKTDTKDLDEAVTRYKNTDNLLESIERKLNKIQSEKDQVWGKKYITTIDKENEALKDQLNIIDQQIKEAKSYQDMDLGFLTNAGIAVELDENGFVKNFEQIEAILNNMEKSAAATYDNTVNSVNASYDTSVNALGKDSNDQKNALKEANQSATDSAKDLYETQKNNIEKIKNKLNSYEDAVKKYYDDTEKREEILQKIRENNYDKLNHKLEIQLELTDLERKQMDTMSKLFRKGLFGIADNNNMDNTKIGTYLNDFKHLEEQLAETNQLYAQGGLSEQQYYEKMKDLNDKLADTTGNIYDLSDAIGDRFIEALNDADDIMDKSISKFGHLRTIMSSVENLIKLTYGEEDFDALGDVYENIAYASEKELKYNRAMFEERKKTMDETRKTYNEAVAGNIPEGKTLDQLKEDLDESENSVREWQEKMYSSAEAFAEDITNVYQNKINKAMKQLENDLTGGKGFDELQEQMDRLQTHDDEYLTGVNQQYETQKMIRTATNALENSSNKIAKNKLELFIKETQELQKQGKLSEYELGIQQKKYEIALAEIALQEAQDNKSQVRLQRDSEGNFNYVYTADEDKVNEAQQKYEDAQNDLYNYIREQEAEIQQKRLENWMNYHDAVKEINEDTTLNDAERAEKLTELYEYHSQRDLELTEQSNAGREASNQAYLDSYTITVQDDIATTTEMRNAHIEMAETVDKATNELQENMKTYTDLMDKDLIGVKDNADNYAINIEKDMAKTGSALEVVQGQTSDWANSMTTLLNNVAERYNYLSNCCQNAMETISGFFADTDYAQMFANTTDFTTMLYAGNARQYMTEHNIADKGKWVENAKGGLDLYDNENYADTIMNSTDLATIANAAVHRIAKMRTSKNYYDGFDDTEQLLKTLFSKEDFDKIVKLMYENHKFTGFDTGGYTGEFGPEGKFAILHEKELVLNQQDTQNLLDTVDIVDKLLNSLEYQNLLQDFNISNVGNGINKDKGTLEQEVTIHAEFPNVQSHNEIEMALSNLVNTASQYANRKKS